ncbi:hypothetical protein [Bradyrhizobium sp. Arg816]|uniref:ATP dependent DNA ligase n=1 Tax=Bradyrhizobium sp. Arg816 TaxID=2998491 RepID=UPI0034D47249
MEPNQICRDPQGARHCSQPETKLTKPVKKPKATWVEPKFYAEVEYRDITSEGLLRPALSKASLANRNSDRRTTFSRHIYRQHY